MKKIIYLMLLMLLGGTAFAQQITKANLQVIGLTCSMCSKATETSLRSLDFIGTITPDLNKNLFVLTFVKGKTVNMDLIKKKVQDAGFSIGNLQATFNFNQLKVNGSGLAINGQQAYHFVNTKSQVLNGEVKATVLDKNFVSNATFKKNTAKFSAESYATGQGMVNGKNTRIYHLSI